MVRVAAAAAQGRDASIAGNIVEGNARRTTREYVHFLNVARGSAAEVAYFIDLSSELGYLPGAVFRELNTLSERICAELEALLQKMELLMIQEEEEEARRRSSKK